ncbi:MAG: hypothetical protein R3C99_27655 [Pirellulaceae bacterium]
MAYEPGLTQEEIDDLRRKPSGSIAESSWFVGNWFASSDLIKSRALAAFFTTDRFLKFFGLSDLDGCLTPRFGKIFDNARRLNSEQELVRMTAWDGDLPGEPPRVEHSAARDFAIRVVRELRSKQLRVALGRWLRARSAAGKDAQGYDVATNATPG